MNPEGKRAIVTGGSRGIGAAIAAALAEAGADVVLVGRDEAALGEVARNTGASILVADLAVDDGIAKTIAGMRPCDILVNNAGIGQLRAVEDISRDDLEATLAVNLRAPMLLTQAAIATMREATPPMNEAKGQIVQVLSGLAYRGMPKWSLYCATKYGLRGFTEAVRHEVAGEGIKLGMVAPGFTETEFFKGWPEPLDFGQALQPDDVAHAVLAMVRQGSTSDIKEITVRNPGSP